METKQQQIPSNETPSGGRGCGMRHGACRGGALFVLLAALLAGAAGGYVGKSFAIGPFGGPFGGRGASLDPANFDSHVERMITRFAKEVDATPAQRDKLAEIAKGAARDLLPLRDKLRAGHQQAIALAGAQNVDRAGMENLRAEQIALADTASKRVTQALADAAEVLTPEQRQKIADHIKGRSEHHRWWRHG